MSFLNQNVKQFQKIYRRIGMWGVVEAIFYPILVPIYVLYAWFRTLWSSRILLFGEWGRYHGYNPLNALNSFFYKTQWLNFEEYGRRGISPVVGLGSYPLNRWFHLTLLSSCLYANAGAVTTLFATLLWVSFHAVWIDAVTWHWVAIISGVLLLSTTSFSMAFVRQNYNVLGWMLLPIALYAVLTGQWSLAALVWFLISLASITVIFTAIPLMLLHATTTGHWEAFFSLLPATIKLGIHIVPMLYGGGLKTTLFNIAKLIGFTSVGVRYQRNSMQFGLINIYISTIYAVACGMLWVDQGNTPLLPLCALGIYIVNQRFIRFADDQSTIMLFITVYSATVIMTPTAWLGLAGLVIAVNPLPVVLGLASAKRDGSVVRIPPLRPFDHRHLQEALERFFDPVPSESRIYFAFNDPLGDYGRLFDGYRRLLELPIFVASSRRVHLFPDWYAVAETNYNGAPNCWGTSPEAVIDNAQRWGASYAIVYQNTGTNLAREWHSLGFEVKRSFDWGDWVDLLQGYSLWDTEKPPKWWVLEVPLQDNSSQSAST